MRKLIVTNALPIESFVRDANLEYSNELKALRQKVLQLKELLQGKVLIFSSPSENALNTATSIAWRIDNFTGVRISKELMLESSAELKRFVAREFYRDNLILVSNETIGKFLNDYISSSSFAKGIDVLNSVEEGFEPGLFYLADFEKNRCYLM